LNWFLKKNRLNTSGELALNRSDISLRNNSIDPNNRTNEKMIVIKPLGMICSSQSITGLKPDQKCSISFSTGATVGTKKYCAMRMDIEESMP